VTPFLESDVNQIDEMIALNVRALTRLTFAVAPKFVARGGGTIINIASVLGVAPELLNGVYGGTKSFVIALSLSLQKELADKNVRIQAVLPSVVGFEERVRGPRRISTWHPSRTETMDGFQRTHKKESKSK
jgi:short-subunit dehydrogenase